MTDQENRNPEQNPQQPVAATKPDVQLGHPLPEKDQVPTGQPKSPQSEQESQDQERQKQA